jgi:hypothetical protein
MKLIQFSFKSEPIWMLVFSLAPGILGLLILILAFLVSWLG